MAIDYTLLTVIVPFVVGLPTSLWATNEIFARFIDERRDSITKGKENISVFVNNQVATLQVALREAHNLIEGWKTHQDDWYSNKDLQDNLDKIIGGIETLDDIEDIGDACISLLKRMRKEFLLGVLAIWTVITIDILVEIATPVDTLPLFFIELLVAVVLLPPRKEMIDKYRQKVKMLEKNKLIKEV